MPRPGLRPAGRGTAAGAAALTFWGFLGVESATVPADKVDDPARTVPRATLIGTAEVTPPIAEPALLATWLALSSLARCDAGMLARHEHHYAAFRKRMEELLGACGMPADRLRLAAIGVTALVDGLRLELCLSPDSFNAGEARALAAAYLASVISTDR